MPSDFAFWSDLWRTRSQDKAMLQNCIGEVNQFSMGQLIRTDAQVTNDVRRTGPGQLPVSRIKYPAPIMVEKGASIGSALSESAIVAKIEQG
jgi:hypothetical protein